MDQSEEKLSDKLKRELESLSHVAKPADQMSASEVFNLYREAGGEIYTYGQIRDGLELKSSWIKDLADQLSKGFRFIAGVWRVPTETDLKALADQLAIHSRQVSDLTSTSADMEKRIRRAAALPRMVELKKLIEDAESQERIAVSLAEGQRRQKEEEDKAAEDAAALARFRASEQANKAAAAGGARTEVLSAEVSAGKPVGGDRETIPAETLPAEPVKPAEGLAPAPPAAAEPVLSPVGGSGASGSL